MDIGAWILVFIANVLAKTAVPVWLQHMLTGYLGKAITDEAVTEGEALLKSYAVRQLDAYIKAHPDTNGAAFAEGFERFLTVAVPNAA